MSAYRLARLRLAAEVAAQLLTLASTFIGIVAALAILA
jgi:hypothetical protein